MKTALLYGPGDFRVETVSDPELTPDGAIIRAKAYAICGSELSLYNRGLASAAVAQRGLEAVSKSSTGHERSGEVIEVGANVTKVKPGDRVAAGGYGGFSEYFAVPNADGLFMLPDDMSYDVGATIEPVGIGVGMAIDAEPTPHDTVVVLGAGMVGQGAWHGFKSLGASKVILTDVVQNRLDAADALGVDMIINDSKEDVAGKILEVTSDLGADIVAICCDDPSAFTQAFELVRGGGIYQHQFRDWGGKPNAAAAAGVQFIDRGGKVMVLSAPGQVQWQPNLLYVKALTVKGCIGGKMAEAYRLMCSGEIKTDSLISHSFPLEETDEAFRMGLKRDESIKVLVKP